MRTALVDELLKIVDRDTFFLTADLGFGILEPLQEKMQDTFINVGLAEQAMIGIASGLALAGKKVFTYTISPFYLRALEQIKLDLCYQDVPVTMIGVGTQFDYEYLGNTHFAFDDDKVMSQLLNIDVYTPKNQKELRKLLRQTPKRPRYIRVGGWKENLDFEIDWKKLDKYPKEVGNREYFKDRYGK